MEPSQIQRDLGICRKRGAPGGWRTLCEIGRDDAVGDYADRRFQPEPAYRRRFSIAKRMNACRAIEMAVLIGPGSKLFLPAAVRQRPGIEHPMRTDDRRCACGTPPPAGHDRGVHPQSMNMEQIESRLPDGGIELVRVSERPRSTN